MTHYPAQCFAMALLSGIIHWCAIVSNPVIGALHITPDRRALALGGGIANATFATVMLAQVWAWGPDYMERRSRPESAFFGLSILTQIVIGITVALSSEEHTPFQSRIIFVVLYTFQVSSSLLLLLLIVLKWERGAPSKKPYKLLVFAALRAVRVADNQSDLTFVRVLWEQVCCLSSFVTLSGVKLEGETASFDHPASLGRKETGTRSYLQAEACAGPDAPLSMEGRL